MTEFQNIELPPNFRAVEGTNKNVFRSSNPDVMNDDAIAYALSTFKIQTILDLRNGSEYKKDCRNSTLSKYFKMRLIKSANNSHRYEHVRFLGKLLGFEYQLQLFFVLSFFNKILVLYYLIKYVIVGSNEYTTFAVTRTPLSTEGLIWQYIFVLDNVQRKMKSVMSVFLQKENFPILICCNAGKDRTGTIAALVMKLCGCSNKETAEAYSQSKELLTPIFDSVKKSMTDVGLAEDFADSPEQVMMAVLRHLETKYNGVEGYLRYIGFTQQEISTMKSNLQNSEE